MDSITKPIGILLAAGSSTRFGSDKLLHRLPDNETRTVAELAARQLLDALPDSIAVIREHDSQLKALFSHLGMPVVTNVDAHLGMSSSIACGVNSRPDATGWVIALADMPYIPSTVIIQVAQALQRDALIAAPVYKGQRGHPVGFSRHLFNELVNLQGDVGAKSIIERHRNELQLLATTDAAILRDIDRKADITQ
ncbi:MAG: nucleotidyltransferase family protein [Gammaproteobacteria bacterium]|jgi:molybdenum cofactor cytidylyltransferase